MASFLSDDEKEEDPDAPRPRGSEQEGTEGLHNCARGAWGGESHARGGAHVAQYQPDPLREHTRIFHSRGEDRMRSLREANQRAARTLGGVLVFALVVAAAAIAVEWWRGRPQGPAKPRARLCTRKVFVPKDGVEDAPGGDVRAWIDAICHLPVPFKSAFWGMLKKEGYTTVEAVRLGAGRIMRLEDFRELKFTGRKKLEQALFDLYNGGASE